MNYVIEMAAAIKHNTQFAQIRIHSYNFNARNCNIDKYFGRIMNSVDSFPACQSIYWSVQLKINGD